MMVMARNYHEELEVWGVGSLKELTQREFLEVQEVGDGFSERVKH